MCREFHKIHRSCRHAAGGTAGEDSYIRQCLPSFFPCSERNRSHVYDLLEREHCDHCLLVGANVLRQMGVGPASYTRCFGVRLAEIIDEQPGVWSWDDLN
jgi:hypothetical protein